MKVEFQGKIFKLKEDAWVDNYDDFGNLLYKAHAVDEDNAEHLLVWHEAEGFEFENHSDLSEACDWDNPVKVFKMER